MFVDGLEILHPAVAQENLGIMACAYDLGPLPVVNGKLWDSGYSDAWRHIVICERVLNEDTKEYKWAVSSLGMCLTKGGNWTYERGMKGKNRNKIRFDCAIEAIEHYFAWKKKEIDRFMKAETKRKKEANKHAT